MSSKMSSKRQIKRSKEKRNQDKMDKAMNDVKKIGIISCCLIAILLVIGIFISPKESYAAGFLQQLPDSFKSGMSDEGKALISDIYLPNDRINNVPHSLMREIAQEDYNWAECKSRLVSKIGVYYTEEELNDYILNYDIWFQNN